MVAAQQAGGTLGPVDPGLPVDPPRPDPSPPTDVLRFSLDLRLQGSKKPADGTLCNIGFVLGRNKTFVLAPHAAYVKEAWTDFGFLHITDVHVSRRIDHFARMLRQAGQQAGADQLNNWNDAFRDLIRYANHLHDLKLLDVIVATGDLVDYEYEWAPHSFEPEDRSALYSWDAKGGDTSNWDFFRQIVLGDIAYPDQAPSLHEELRVPIFTTLGNHDYRQQALCPGGRGEKAGRQSQGY